MSDTEIFDLPEDENVVKLPAKKSKAKKEMSDERRAQLLLNLKKGRETSKKNRAKNKTAKEIIKRKKKDFIDETIREEVLTQEKEKQSYQEMKDELDQIKELMRKQMEKPAPVKTYKFHVPSPITCRVPTRSESHREGGNDSDRSNNIKMNIIEPSIPNKVNEEYTVGKHYSNKELVTKKNTEEVKDYSTFKTIWD